MSDLFKDNIKKSQYSALINKLRKAVEEGEETLKLLLFGMLNPDLYSDHGDYKEGQHNKCNGLKEDTFTEKRLCKCIYYYNTPFLKKCDKCDFKQRYKLIGDYEICDYEVPAFYYGKGIGEIDVIIKGKDAVYATEIKPYKGNDETLLRMIAEIMTYTLGYPNEKYKKAIAFFENTTQENEYLAMTSELKLLIKEADITMFRFEKIDEETYAICKLCNE